MTSTYSDTPQRSNTESFGRRAVEYLGKLFGRLDELPLDKKYRDITFDLESVFAHLMRRRFARDPTAYEAFIFAANATAQMRMINGSTDAIIARLEELSAHLEQESKSLRERLDRVSEKLENIERDLFEPEA